MLKPGLKRHQNNHPSKPDVVFVNFYCICIQMLFICFAFVCRIAQCHLYEMKSAQIHVFIAHILRIGFPMFFFGFWPRPKIFGFSHLQVALLLVCIFFCPRTFISARFRFWTVVLVSLQATKWVLKQCIHFLDNSVIPVACFAAGHKKIFFYKTDLGTRLPTTTTSRSQHASAASSQSMTAPPRL